MTNNMDPDRFNDEELPKNDNSSSKKEKGEDFSKEYKSDLFNFDSLKQVADFSLPEEIIRSIAGALDLNDLKRALDTFAKLGINNVKDITQHVDNSLRGVELPKLTLEPSEPSISLKVNSLDRDVLYRRLGIMTDAEREELYDSLRPDEEYSGTTIVNVFIIRPPDEDLSPNEDDPEGSSDEFSDNSGNSTN